MKDRTIMLGIMCTLFMTLLLISCNENEITPSTQEQQPTEVPSDEELDFGPDRSFCTDDLANDGCNFISGSGRDYPNQYLMVNMMNNCRTESLPANCSWAGNITETRDIEVDLNNCCYPFNSMNARLNNWKALAIASKPASNYLITHYQHMGGFMVTTYGPYRMKIRVTYRKKGICMEVEDRKK